MDQLTQFTASCFLLLALLAVGRDFPLTRPHNRIAPRVNASFLKRAAVWLRTVLVARPRRAAIREFPATFAHDLAMPRSSSAVTER
jgi:hypothetical protein